MCAFLQRVKMKPAVVVHSLLSEDYFQIFFTHLYYAVLFTHHS
jgi:hypothetical protein